MTAVQLPEFDATHTTDQALARLNPFNSMQNVWMFGLGPFERQMA
jgi:hypothetical protein